MKQFLLCVLTLAMTFVFSACSNDDNDSYEYSSMGGVWVYEKTDVVLEPNNTIYDDRIKAIFIDEEKNRYGAYSIELILGDKFVISDKESSGNKTGAGTYYIKDGHIVITYEDGEGSSFLIKDQNIILEEVIDDEVFLEDYVYEAGITDESYKLEKVTVITYLKRK